MLKVRARVVPLSATRLGFTKRAWRVDFGTGAYAALKAGGRPGTTTDSFGDLSTREVAVAHEGFVRG